MWNFETDTGLRDAAAMPLAITHARTTKIAWLVPAQAGEAGLAATYVETQTHAD